MYIAKENQLDKDEYEEIFQNFEPIETINNEVFLTNLYIVLVLLYDLSLKLLFLF